MTTAIILGTRPEIIKMAPIIREYEHRGLDYFIIHTGQHYSYQMDNIFFEQLELPEAKHKLDIGSASHAKQTGRIMNGVEKVLIDERPDVILVQGDTNTVLAGSLAASKLHIKIGHVEAGLRSYDRSMPEEINRIVADHISDYLFAPTTDSMNNLLKEGISEEIIYLTGNTIVDSVYQNLEISKKKGNALDHLEIMPNGYFLATAHRAENVDNPARLEEILRGFLLVGKEFSLPVVFPIHPRTMKMVKQFGLSLNGIRVIEPVGYLEFLQLEAAAKLILTDSGGVQEEACILNVPCVTLRDNTERPETVSVNSNTLVGANSARILNETNRMIKSSKKWMNPFGDGKTGENIAKILN